MTDLTALAAAAVGFAHAFEADHLLAVGNVVSRRGALRLAVRDGLYWGLGHTSTLLLVGMAVVLGRASLPAAAFGWLEASVGVALVALGAARLATAYRERRGDSRGDGASGNGESADGGGAGLAYGLGLLQGLAGSGAVILLMLTQVGDAWYGLLYLFAFGIGSAGGMLVAAGLFGLPFSRSLLERPGLQSALTALAAVVCMVYGGYVVVSQVG